MERFAPLVLLLTCFNNILLPFHLSTSPCHFVTHKGHAVNDTGLAGLGEGGRYSGRVSGSGRGGGGGGGLSSLPPPDDDRPGSSPSQGSPVNGNARVQGPSPSRVGELPTDRPIPFCLLLLSATYHVLFFPSVSPLP